MTIALDQQELEFAASPAKARNPGLFRSYWIAGFEGADHINGTGIPLSLNQLNGHWDRLAEDYKLLAPFGIKTVRESVGWRLTEHQGAYDWQRLEHQARIAAEHGIQVIWTLLHYGWPADVSPFAPDFADRFARFCEQVARKLKPFHDTTPFFQPINEISFLTWAVCSAGLVAPNDVAMAGHGYEFKKQLVKAALRGSEAILSVEPRARIVHTDPVVHVIPPAGADAAMIEETRRFREFQFQAWDMLCGRSEPQLGGSRRHLDILGLNYYHSNQWVYKTEEILFWHLKDSRRIPFRELATEVWRRYERPMFIAETSHVGEGRCEWLDDICSEILACEQRGVPIEGICLYPIIDRPDWENLDHWHHSGLWDIDPVAGKQDFERLLHQPYAKRLCHWQVALHPPQCTPPAPHPQQIDLKGTIVMPPTILVFSHLRWNFVYQRPQHLLSRLAGRYRIIFMEEPVNNAADAFLERFTPCAEVEVLRPHVPGEAYGFDDANILALEALLKDYLAAHGIDDFVAWFYTPMALPLLENLKPRNIIYDCMDELSAFKNAPAQLIHKEKALFDIADLVFTGGPSLHQSKKAHHSNIHCFMSSVDASHFAPAVNEASAGLEPLSQRDIPHPRLGYYGVIDERIDIELIAALADARPDWHIVMVGPIVKIDPLSLPQRHNIHWLGQRSYEELPRFLAGWDVCLLPFALNESTRYISPTKTLEYMAAQRSMVSTRIKDVEEPYGHVVPIARTHAEFIQNCELLLNETEKERAIRLETMRNIVAKTSWDKTALAMHNLIAKLQPQPEMETSGVVPLPVTIHNAPSYNVPVTGASSIPHYDTVIIGAGPTGLSAAYHLGKGSLLLEAQSTVGGWCRSIEDKGFTFDFAGHIMFSNDEYVLEMYKKLLGDNIHWQNREAWIYSKDVYTRYPFQGALYGLPPDVLKECVMGAIEARFGPLKKEDRRAAASSTEKGAVVGEAKPPQNFEEFIYKVWGAGVAKHFAIPYNKKLWAVPLEEMETSWLGSRVPMPDLEEMIEGALKPVPKPMGPNARFGYPLKGGFQALMNGFLPHLKGDLQFNAKVVGVSPSKRIVTLADGRRFRYDNLISTLPLPKLVQAMGDEAPEDLKQAAGGLRHVSVRCVNLGIGRPNISEKHWVYYPEYPIFHRIFLQGNASPHCNPPGGFGLTCEITYSEYKPLPYSGQALIERCIDDCVRVGMINADDPIWTANEIDIPYAYVVYDHDRINNVATIRDWVADKNIVLAGRYSEWEYYNSDHAFIAGKKAAEQVAAGGRKGKMAANV